MPPVTHSGDRPLAGTPIWLPSSGLGPALGTEDSSIRVAIRTIHPSINSRPQSEKPSFTLALPGLIFNQATLLLLQPPSTPRPLLRLPPGETLRRPRPPKSSSRQIRPSIRALGETKLGDGHSFTQDVAGADMR